MTQNAPTPPMSAPGGLARRFWGNASANEMPATLSRDQSSPNNMARHRTLRRAMASASAKMPRRMCLLGLTDWKLRDAECADTAYVGARRPCLALQGRRVRRCYARNVLFIYDYPCHQPKTSISARRDMMYLKGDLLEFESRMTLDRS